MRTIWVANACNGPNRSSRPCRSHAGAISTRRMWEQVWNLLRKDKLPTGPHKAARARNRWTRDGMQRFRGRVLGYCYVNPGFKKEALEEIKRCVGDHGFIGIKLYNEYICTDPVVYPVVELAIELGVPILHHAGHLH